jgi:hypothetical protein
VNSRVRVEPPHVTSWKLVEKSTKRIRSSWQPPGMD